MPSAPRLVGRPSVPRGPRHADLRASRQLSARLPIPTARLRPRCRRIPILPRARPPIAQNFSFGERTTEPPSAHVQPPARDILSESDRIPSKEGAERSRNPGAAERAGLRPDKRRRTTKHPFAAEPLSAPRLRPRPPKRPARLLETRWAEGTVASARPTFC